KIPSPGALANTAVPGAVVTGSNSGPEVAPMKDSTFGLLTLTLNPNDTMPSVVPSRPAKRVVAVTTISNGPLTTPFTPGLDSEIVAAEADDAKVTVATKVATS